MLKIDTSNILIICGGAFVGLDKIIENRVTQHPLGFGSDIRRSQEKDLVQLFGQMHPDDLVKYGLIPEFIGRLPIQVSLQNLLKEDLKRIITEPRNSVIKQFEESLKLDDAELAFEEAALDAIAEKALERKTGARGIRSIVESVMLEIMYDLPSMEGQNESDCYQGCSIQNDSLPVVLTDPEEIEAPLGKCTL